MKKETITANSSILNSHKKPIAGDLTHFSDLAKVMTPETDLPRDLPAIPLNAPAQSDQPGGYKTRYAEKLDGIIQKCRLAALFNEYAPDVLKKAVAAWLEICLAAGIPLDALNDCYLAARRRRAQLLNDTGSAPAIDADFFASQWRATVKTEYEKKNRGRRLQAAPTTDCPDCFGNATRRRYRKINGFAFLTDEICRHENLPETIAD